MSAQPEIRTVPVDDMHGWLRTFRTGLLEDPGARSDAGDAWWASIWDAERTIGAYAEGRCVATLQTFATSLSVPTGEESCADLPIDALTMVSVAATHRRRGLLTGMLTPSLAAARERGEVASLLAAAEWPIYGRFGYAPATFAADYQITGRRDLSILAPDAPIEIVQLDMAELLGPAAGVLARVRQQRAGHIDRAPEVWQRWSGLNGLSRAGAREPVCVIARNADGGIDGYARWSAAASDWFHEPQQSTATVHELLAATGDAYRALWRYLLNIDLVAVLKLNGRPVDEPLEWLLSDGRVARRTWTGDGYWLRLLDIPAVLSARRYQVTDRLVLRIEDPEGGYAAGTFSLDGGPEHAECHRAPGASPDVTLSQRALASIYLGGSTVRSQRLAGLIDENTAGGLGRLERMFRTVQAPWNATPF